MTGLTGWEPAVEVVHDCHRYVRLAQPCGKADQRVLKESGLRDAELVLAAGLPGLL